MSGSLFDQSGSRKYLVAAERIAFVVAAPIKEKSISAFCITLAASGGRVSEVLALTPGQIDLANGAIVFQTLKQRPRRAFRAVPVPAHVLGLLRRISGEPGARLWPWGRTTAWKVAKSIMREANIAEVLCKPKALRHAFAVEAG